MANLYQQRGFASRDEYLDEVGDVYGLDSFVVQALADMLGEQEDFDGLLSACANEANCVVMQVGSVCS